VLVARIAPGFITASSSGEDLVLDRHVLEHRLDDQITVCDSSAIVGDCTERGKGGVAAVNGQLAALHCRVEVCGDRAARLVGAPSSSLDEGHGESGQQAGGGDARAHGSAADDADLSPRRVTRCHRFPAVSRPCGR
jgi:hypothetical protein